MICFWSLVVHQSGTLVLHKLKSRLKTSYLTIVYCQKVGFRNVIVLLLYFPCLGVLFCFIAAASEVVDFLLHL